MIHATCPHCRRVTPVPDHVGGHPIQCPECRRMFDVPASVSQPPARHRPVLSAPIMGGMIAVTCVLGLYAFMAWFPRTAEQTIGRNPQGPVEEQSSPDHPSVHAAQVRILNWRFEPPTPLTEYGRVVGELRNEAPIPLRIQVEVIGRDDAARVVDAQEFWPDGPTVVQPGESRPFHFPLRGRNITAAEVKIAEVSPE